MTALKNSLLAAITWCNLFFGVLSFGVMYWPAQFNPRSQLLEIVLTVGGKVVMVAVVKRHGWLRLMRWTWRPVQLHLPSLPARLWPGYFLFCLCTPLAHPLPFPLPPFCLSHESYYLSAAHQPPPHFCPVWSTSSPWQAGSFRQCQKWKRLQKGCRAPSQ